MITRRQLAARIMGLVGSLGLGACSHEASRATNETANATGGFMSGEVAASTPDVGAEAQVAEEKGDIVSDDGLRELVRMDLPSDEGVDYGHVSPDPLDSEGTVLTAEVDPTRSQQLFLWEEGNAPGDLGSMSRSYGYDPADFRPTVTSVPVSEGVEVKGAVLLCAGGAFAIRGDNSDCYPTARELSRRGYQCFVVDYRLRPYGQEVSGVDLARAIRFVRAHWQDYGLPSERPIVVGGYSAGGILCGETILNQGGSHSPAEVDASYVPDELDAIDASVAADAMIYSFYGQLSLAEKSADVLGAGSLPPTYYCYGTRDPFYRQFEVQVDLMASLGYTVRARVLDGWPHGFGAEGGWVPEFCDFMEEEAFCQAT